MEFLSLLTLALAAMVPITLTSVGEVFTEKSGVVNIGLEGILLISAFTALWGAEASGNAWIGLLTGLGTGAFIGWMHGIISITLKGDQVISGIGINLFGLGLVAFGIVAIWKSAGYHQAPTGAQVPSLTLPGGGEISPLVPLTILIAFVTWYLLNRTVLGLHVKAAGENPEAADVAGISVERTRYIATIYGASLAGLGGAYLSIDWLSTITKEISAGRGFIALANVVFSGLNPLLALLGGFLFGFFDTVALWIDTQPDIKSLLGFGVHNFVKMIPYVATLVVVAVAIGHARFPKHSGQPYRRE
jgi:simple sugar transport system permease protein